MSPRGDVTLIWGAGAIGGILGAYLARAGVAVEMVDVAEDHVRICSTEGLTIEGPVDAFRQVVPTMLPEAVIGQHKCIILAVKAQATRAAMTALLPHLAPDGFVLSAQNGLNERVIAEMAGPERCMGALVNYGADWQGPGRILFGNRGAVVIGELDGSARPRSLEMLRLMQIFEPNAVLSDNIWGYLWGKLGYSAMLYATALAPDSMTANFADQNRAPVFVTLGREVMAVAKSESVDPQPFNGFDPMDFQPEASDEQALACIARLAEFNATTAKSHSGVWRDLAVRKRKTDVEHMAGAVADIAAKNKVATPLLNRLRSLIHDIEEGRRNQSAETFDMLSRETEI